MALWFQSALLAEGWAEGVRMDVSAGRIARIEPGTRPEPGDERHGHAVPGLPNLHSHAFQRAMAGLAERRGPGADSFWTWRQAMYGFVDRLEPDDVEAIAGQAFMEMLETGFTRVAEFHYLHHDPAGRAYRDIAEMATRIAAAAAATGIGLTLLPVFYAHGGFGGQATADAQRRFVTDVERFARLQDGCEKAIRSLDGAVLGVAPHSLRAVTPEELRQVAALGSDGPVHIHVAEQMKEVEDCLAWSGARPVEWLLEHAAVDSRWCLVHATHVTPSERSAIAASGAVVGLCPITEANLGDGIFDAARYREAGGQYGIGSDSNVLIDAAEEMRLLEYGQRLSMRGRNLLSSVGRPSTGRTMIDDALTGGARATGASPASLAVGAPADILTLDPMHSALIGRTGDALLDGWIFASRASPIDRVWRAGRMVVADGRHVTRDAIEARYRTTIERLTPA
ncbi:MAG: formimidoylglutamate deiminase [Alphaproteobacteria bacterium]